MSIFESLLTNKFIFSHKDDFKIFDTVYENDVDNFKSDIKQMIDDFLIFTPSSGIEIVRCAWSALNFIELCIYYDIYTENFGGLLKCTVDLIHTVRWDNGQDLSLSVQGFKLNMTLTSIISQSFCKGSYRDWHYGIANQSLFKEVFSEVEITNTTRASICYKIAQESAQKIPKGVKDVMSAMHLCDSLYGNGIESFLEGKTAEQAKKKMSILYRVNLNEIATRILGYYQCISGNQKKRYVEELISWYKNYDKEIIAILDRYLHSLCCDSIT